MADWNEQNAENVEGRFFVDNSCVDCDLCRGSAPEFFTREDNRGYSYVHRQPVTPEEVEEAMLALDNCPSSSIGVKS